MTATDRALVTAFVDALAHRDRTRLVALIAPDVRLRALLPSRDVDVTGPDAVLDQVLGWFSEVGRIEVRATTVDLVGDVWHAGYDFALHGAGSERITQQHIYCTIRDGSIATLRLICSGFRLAAPQPSTVDENARIDALGEGCSTLTPRIAAAMRELAPGEVLSVLTDDPSAPADIGAWSRLTGHTVVASADEAHGTRYYFRRRS
jgi:tRNA 2-thiouridine synthesizing protein A